MTRFIRHILFVALLVLGSIGAIRGPDNFQPDNTWEPKGYARFAVAGERAILLPDMFASDGLGHDGERCGG